MGPHDAPSDLALIQACIVGDNAAWGQLLQRVVRICRATVEHSVWSGGPDPDDLASDVVLHLMNDGYRALREFRAAAPLDAWLRRIAHNSLVDWARRARRERPSEEITEAADGEAWQSTAADAGMDARAEILPVWPLLRANDREILGMLYLQEMAYQEIASALDITCDSARKRAQRARARARTLLAVQAHPERACPPPQETANENRGVRKR